MDTLNEIYSDYLPTSQLNRFCAQSGNLETLRIFKGEPLKNHVIDIRTKNYHKAVSIIVTLERFGQIQTDLSTMLEIYDNDDYPWSICIDDLEIFLLQMEKSGKKTSDLVQFLNLREQLHGRLITGDELEVCGAFLNEKLTKKQVENDGNIDALTPDLADIFDKTYQTKGLGFDKEKIWKLKRVENIYRWAGFKQKQSLTNSRTSTNRQQGYAKMGLTN